MAGGSVAGPRGRGGKFNKPTRGGGKHYSRSLQPVDADGNQVSMWSAGAADERSEDDSEEESSEEESDHAGPSKATADVENRDDPQGPEKGP
ncbi:hypothetical protein J3459_008163 [Metarhizium acridum]|nr:hypothetical protein J3459_008163 [Metarhizium acridum]